MSQPPNLYHVTFEPMKIFSQIVAAAVLDETSINVLDELSLIVYDEGTLTDVTLLTANRTGLNTFRVSDILST